MNIHNLESELANLDGIDEKYKALYEEEDGKFKLTIKTPDLEAKARVDEFRKNNIDFKKEIDSLKEQLNKVKDIDPEKYEEMKKQLNKAEEKKALDEGDTEKVIEARVANMKEQYESQISELTKALEESKGKYEKAQNELNSATINESVMELVDSEFKIRKGALPDLLSRVREVWRLEEGKLVAYNGAGENAIKTYGKDGKELLTMKEYLEGLQKSAAHLFENNEGGGATGNREPGAGNTGNTLDWNDSEAIGRNLEKVASGEIKVATTR